MYFTLKDTYAVESGDIVWGTQLYDLSPESANSDLGQPIPHHSAPQHTTGEAEYVDDIPHVEGIINILVYEYSQWKVVNMYKW